MSELVQVSNAKPELKIVYETLRESIIADVTSLLLGCFLFGFGVMIDSTPAQWTGAVLFVVYGLCCIRVRMNKRVMTRMQAIKWLKSLEKAQKVKKEPAQPENPETLIAAE